MQYNATMRDQTVRTQRDSSCAIQCHNERSDCEYTRDSSRAIQCQSEIDKASARLYVTAYSMQPQLELVYLKNSKTLTDGLWSMGQLL